MSLEAPIAAVLERWKAVDPALAVLVARLVSLALTLGVLVVGYRLLLGVIDGLFVPRQGEGDTSHRLQRSRTLGTLLRSLARWLVGFVGLAMVLSEFGVNVQALVVSAGVLGIAVGFGAQSLIKDILTGVFLLFEGLVAVGDTIQVGTATGTVEAIELRVTKLRMEDGGLRVIPNGQLGEFVNYSRDWARAIVEVTVPREVPVDRALEALRRVGEEWAAAAGASLDVPKAEGIMRFSGGDVVLRLAAKVEPSRRVDTEADLRRRVKAAFDREHWPPIGVPQ